MLFTGQCVHVHSGQWIELTLDVPTKTHFDIPRPWLACYWHELAFTLIQRGYLSSLSKRNSVLCWWFFLRDKCLKSHISIFSFKQFWCENNKSLFILLKWELKYPTSGINTFAQVMYIVSVLHPHCPKEASHQALILGVIPHVCFSVPNSYRFPVSDLRPVELSLFGLLTFRLG